MVTEKYLATVYHTLFQSHPLFRIYIQLDKVLENAEIEKKISKALWSQNCLFYCSCYIHKRYNRKGNSDHNKSHKPMLNVIRRYGISHTVKSQTRSKLDWLVLYLRAASMCLRISRSNGRSARELELAFQNITKFYCSFWIFILLF